MNVVLDTNCLIASLSKRGDYFNVWRGLHQGLYTLFVSNEILDEYAEVLAQKTTPEISDNVIQAIVNSLNVQFIDPYFQFMLITADKDDNKFVDCAIAANASYIVTNDTHFKVLKEISFPKISVLDIKQFSMLISSLE